MGKIIIFFFCVIAMTSCDPKIKSKINPGFFADGYEIPYSLNAPDQVMRLNRDLVEISGLTYSEMSGNLLAINDEDADIFVLDPLTGVILDKYDFGKSDDYEGVASHNDMIYVIESDGNVKVINESTGKKITEYDDILSKNNDVEGICYNPVTGTLLLAAKGDSEVKGNDKGHKAVFSMDVSSGKINPKPFLYQDLAKATKELDRKYIESNLLVDLSVKSRIKKYGPSAIAVQPKSGLIFILSSTGKLLTVSDQMGNMKAITFLKNSMHVQPEGITFAPDGTLYISNEGRSGKGVIYRYNLVTDIQSSLDTTNVTKGDSIK